MLPEAPVLDGDRRIAQIGGDLVEPQRLAIHARRDDTEQRAVVGVHEGVLSERHRLERIQVAGAEQHRTTGRGAADDHDRQQDDGDGGRDRDPALRPEPAQAGAAREQDRRELEVGTIPVPHCEFVVARARPRETGAVLRGELGQDDAEHRKRERDEQVPAPDLRQQRP